MLASPLYVFLQLFRKNLKSYGSLKLLAETSRRVILWTHDASNGYVKDES